ncbi:MAG: pitrilysin family protein [Syntrophaceae bacterium]
MCRKTVLDNGIRIISEEITYVRSVSIGAWVGCGSRYEKASINGAAHFIEHMLFKGTKTRSALDIASEIDSVGGILNAYTGKEVTSYYVKIPDYHLPLAIDLLADILNNSLFDPEELEKERSVILQEINMVEDTPDDYIHDFFSDIFWKNHPLGFPVLGTRETVGNLGRDSLLDFFAGNYTGDNLLIAAAGNMKHDDLVNLVRREFAKNGKKIRRKAGKIPEVKTSSSVMEKDLEQVHAIIGAPAPQYASELRYPGFILNAVLGGSMSSRLFQEIREKRGLAYAIHSYMVSFHDTGMLGIYFGADGERLEEISELTFIELQRIKTELLTEKELRSVKEQIKGNFLLSMESTDNRMMKLAKNEIYFHRNIPAEETVEGIEAVSADDVRKLAEDMFSPKHVCFAAIGNVPCGELPLKLFADIGLSSRKSSTA